VSKLKIGHQRQLTTIGLVIVTTDATQRRLTTVASRLSANISMS